MVAEGDRVIYSVRVWSSEALRYVQKDIHGTVTRSNDTVTTFRDDKGRPWTVPTKSLRKA